MSKTALVTGASSGIGAAFARQLARDGYHVVLVARRVEKLEALAAELTAMGTAERPVRASVLPADLARPGAADALYAAVTALGLHVDLLINNAGLGVHGPFEDVTAEDDQRTIDLNISALTAMTRAFLPAMLARAQGAVINVASTAAFQPIPFFAVYAASKAYVLSFSEALAEEVAGRGVKVLCLCPGPTVSEFGDHAAFKTDIIDKAPMMTAEAVVAEALSGLRAGRTVQVAGLLNALSAMAPRFLPRQVIAKVSGTLFKPTK